jgi:uncharacterized protein (TIGR01777 family)
VQIMRVVIPGGTGQVGTLLARALHAEGHDVVVLSRTPRPAPWRVAAWDAKSVGAWTAELEGADAVVNLAGRSVNCRDHAANRRAILESRVDSTRAVGQAIAGCSQPPRVWLQMSTATLYAHRFDAANDEETGIIGGREPGVPETWRFSIDVATAWEQAARATATPRTRLVLMRTAMVMSPDRGGVFDTLLGLVRRGLGGRAGDGRQFVSWIHELDFVRAVTFLIADESLAGPVNVAAPEPLSNAEFMRAIREAWGVRFGLPAQEWMLALGAWAMRTETELILKSRRVVPGRLVERGFAFAYSTWPAAVRELCGRVESRTRSGTGSMVRGIES